MNQFMEEKNDMNQFKPFFLFVLVKKSYIKIIDFNWFMAEKKTDLNWFSSFRDDDSSYRGGGSSSRGRGFSTRGGCSSYRSGGSRSRDGGSRSRDGGSSSRGGGSSYRGTGFSSRGIRSSLLCSPMLLKPPLVPVLTAWRFPSLWGKRNSIGRWAGDFLL